MQPITVMTKIKWGEKVRELWQSQAYLEGAPIKGGEVTRRRKVYGDSPDGPLAHPVLSDSANTPSIKGSSLFPVFW